MSRTRIFVTTSHISCVYMTLHARRTRLPDDSDVLLIDVGTRRKQVVDAISATAGMHDWSLVHSFSGSVGEDHSFEPSLIKRLTRKWKEAAVFRWVYGQLLARREHERNSRLIVQLRQLIPALTSGSAVQVFGHTQTLLNDLIVRSYRESEQFFFEHGLGDYHYILEHGSMKGPLFAVFAQRFRMYLAKRGLSASGVQELDVSNGFPAIATAYLEKHGKGRSVLREVDLARPIVLVLLEAVDMYEVPMGFWGAYIDHILGALDHGDYHFLLKPHPSASRISLDATVSHCRSRGLSFTLLDEAWQMSIAAEVLFAELAPRTQHVFCLFSSACFYLSQLYQEEHICYHYSTSFIAKWIDNAPPMYKRHFAALVPLIEEVFAERCLPY